MLLPAELGSSSMQMENVHKWNQLIQGVKGKATAEGEFRVLDVSKISDQGVHHNRNQEDKHF